MHRIVGFENPSPSRAERDRSRASHPPPGAEESGGKCYEKFMGENARLGSALGVLETRTPVHARCSNTRYLQDLD